VGPREGLRRPFQHPFLTPCSHSHVSHPPPRPPPSPCTHAPYTRQVAVLKLYHGINKRLPGIQEPPTRDAIRKALLAFDSNRDGVLSKSEFVSFVQNVVTLGPDKFFKNVIVNTGVLPAAAVAFKKISNSGVAQYIPAMAQMAGIPPVVLAPLMGVVGKTVRGLIPI